MTMIDDRENLVKRIGTECPTDDELQTAAVCYAIMWADPKIGDTYGAMIEEFHREIDDDTRRRWVTFVRWCRLDSAAPWTASLDRLLTGWQIAAFVGWALAVVLALRHFAR